MATKIWLSIDSGDGLLPDGTKPLPGPMLINYQMYFVAFTWKQFINNYSSAETLVYVWKLPHF